MKLQHRKLLTLQKSHHLNILNITSKWSFRNNNEQQICQDIKFYFNETERLILYFYALKFEVKKIRHKVGKNK